MKFVICNEMFGDWLLEWVFVFVCDCGYMGVEIAFFMLGVDVEDICSTSWW